ncbi:hypothetical protein K8I85_01325 [bacterium]|nr:hypothetical protein [bacterium]
MRKVAIVLAATAALMAVTVQADTVEVTGTGTVLFNGINTPPLNGVNGGETAVARFTVDSNSFLELAPGDVRGYLIDAGSFQLTFSGGVTVGLLGGAPQAYFGVVDGFPVSDGFFVSESAISPGGVQLEQAPYNFNLDLGYDGSTLSSLDILSATGFYTFGGLTRFSMTLWSVFPDNAVMEMDFVSLEIQGGPVSVDDTAWSRVKAMYR